MPEPLRLVDPETGELHEKPKSAQEHEDEVAGLQETIRSQAGKIGALRRDLRPEEDHELFPSAKQIHDYWKARCKHPHHKPQKAPGCAACKRLKFTVDRFKEILPRLREENEDGQDGVAMCLLAIDGAAFDCFTKPRKNGTVKRYDDLALIFRADKFQDFVNRAPFHLPKPEHLSIVSKAILWRHPEMEYEQVTAEARIRVRRWAL